jgi:hypothetical protein
MNLEELGSLYDLTDCTAVVTGGAGMLGTILPCQVFERGMAERGEVVVEDLLGATLWLVSPAAAFVTGAVIPIDGGFSAFSGV